MNTERRVQEKLSKLKEIRAIKLGVIEDAIAEEKQRIESASDEYINNSYEIYEAIEEFWDVKDSLIKKLSASSTININEVYSLYDEMEKLGAYGIDFGMKMEELASVEPVVDAAKEIINGLESIRTNGIG
jgi:hypothetical protein